MKTVARTWLREMTEAPKFWERCVRLVSYCIPFALASGVAVVTGSILFVVLSNLGVWLRLHPLLIVLTIALCALCIPVFFGALFWIYGSAMAMLQAIGLIGPCSKSKISRQEAADVIDRFVENKVGNAYDWDDFCVPDAYEDPVVQAAVDECIEIDRKYPPSKLGQYCNEDGKTRLREIRDSLRDGESSAQTRD